MENLRAMITIESLSARFIAAASRHLATALFVFLSRVGRDVFTSLIFILIFGVHVSSSLCEKLYTSSSSSSDMSRDG